MFAGALLGGGAMGALITATVTSYRNRVQPVRYRIETTRLFESMKPAGARALPVLSPGEMQIDVTVTDHEGSFRLENLHTVEFEIVNSGNQDKNSFAFGATFPADHRVISVQPKTPDRHHVVTVLTTVSLGLLGVVGTGWEADAVYLQVPLSGYIDLYGATGTALQAVETLHMFLGLGLALRLFKYEAVYTPTTFGPPRSPYYVHRRAEGRWAYDTTINQAG